MTRRFKYSPQKMNMIFLIDLNFALHLHRVANMYAELNYQPSDVPKCDRYLNIESVMNVDISVSELEAKLIPELVDEIIEETTESECRDCDGKGTMECDLEHEHDCNECGGDGKIITIIKKPTGKKIPNQEKKYKLLGVGFMYKQLRRLIDACRLLEIETITKTFGTNGVGNLFKCGNAWILVMPCLTTDDEENEFTIIL